MNRTMFMIGEKVSYKGELAIVTRTKVLGIRECCAIQIKWNNDENRPQTILKYHELDDVSKVQ